MFLRQFTGNNNLGDGSFAIYGRCSRPKEILGALIGAGISALGSLFGSSASASAEQKAEAQMNANKASNDAWYKRRYNESYLDTAAGQNLVRQARELTDRQTKRAEGAAAVGGGTDASVALAKENANKTISDTMANIAAQDTARKDNADAIHYQDNQTYSNQQVALQQQKANNIATAASGLSNSLASAAGALDGAYTKKSVISPASTMDTLSKNY